jgi:hypothetical protein
MITWLNDSAHRWLEPALTALLIGASLPAAAHHGAAGLFDESTTIEITGTVSQWSFVNPHPVLVLAVESDDGRTVEWDVYFGPAAASAMQRRGYAADTFAVGETVTVRGHPAAAAGVRGIDVTRVAGKVTRADGSDVP